ncbi:MAG: pitrilysin family protein [Rhodothermales bacterium]
MHERIVEIETDASRIRCLKADVEEVVSLRLSWPLSVGTTNAEVVWTDLASMLMDKGTVNRSKADLSALFEDRGADFNVATDGLQMRAGLRCLTRDFGELFPIVAECLWEAAYPEPEISLAAGRLRTHIMREKSDTASQAGTALAARLFPETHPNHDPGIDARLAVLQELDFQEFRSFAMSRLRPSPLHMAVVGDVQPGMVQELAETHLHGRPVRDVPARTFLHAARATGGQEHVMVADRKNLDVRIGHALGLDRSHPDFDALSVAVFVLGGNFSSRLMSTVRDQDGLTYGVGSGLQGFDRDVSGAWVTRISLSQENLDRGLRRTHEEIERFVTGGISPEELEEVVQTMAGSWLVHLGTTGGMAGRIRRHMELGMPAKELDEWPVRLHHLRAEDVNRIIREWLDPSALWTCSAGERIPTD